MWMLPPQRNFSLLAEAIFLMKLYTINTGHFRLDGGAMFGVVPKSIWNKLNPADANNMCSWALRCLLIEDGNRLILVDNGIGDKQDQKFFSYYYLHGNDTLQKSLAAHGLGFDDITDMVMTHLHFDHCGGSIRYNENRSKLEPAFRNAKYYCSKKHWDSATHPNAREKASFLKENIFPMQESAHLEFIDENSRLIEGLSFLEVNGHTDSMMLPVIRTGDKTIAFMADLIPSSAHIPLPYVMGYDVRPLETMQEKERILNRAAEEKWCLFFEHDPVVECAMVEKTDKGVKNTAIFPLKELGLS
jgi:glyoxylase-like metal-dependent hydrolase (beta-lactamase superfamily II)